MAVEMVDHLAILVVRRFLGMGEADSRSWRSDNYVAVCLENNYMWQFA
jgi:hypothetical protein